jgi:SWI/SNF-related matrix-associated actin-dependent regulator of chromatin subfamily A3
MSGNKRNIEIVDLTGSDDEGIPRKAARPASKAPGWSSSLPATYLTPPHSSQPRSSQSSSQRYNDRPGPLNPRAANVPAYHSAESSATRAGWGVPSTQQLDEDVRGEIEVTEDFDDDVYTGYELYGILNTKVVGVRYYNGRIATGEYVKVKREPRNPYDQNAIRIDNVMNDQIGHIGRNVAAKLAPLIDSQQLLVEGAITGAKRAFDVPIALKMFGTTQPGPGMALKQEMQRLGLPVTNLIRVERERQTREKELEKQRRAMEKASAAMRRNGGTVIDQANRDPKYGSHGIPGSQREATPIPGMDQLPTGTATFNPRDVEDAVKQLGVGEDVLSAMPMAAQPEMLSTILLPYQRQGLQWLLDHESPELPVNRDDDSVQLWKASNGVYTNLATNFSVTKSPDLASGGILGDDMGLGKTIQIISLIMADPHKTKQPTLIIAPLSVMSNWSNQAAAHVKKKYAPRVFIYHGQENKSLSPSQLEKYDIVITTYQTMALELYPYGKKEAAKVPSSQGLFSITWRRVVLDEGHQIRNPKAKMTVAASSLMAKSRWILTGTPIVNSLKDLYSHVRFLRLPGGLCEFEIFNSTLIRPLKSGNPNAQMLLRALMSTICLRRMKDMKFIDLKLPELTFHQVPVKFLKHEQERYDAFEAEAKGVLEEAKAKKAKGNGTITHLLEILLRMRQVTNHWKLVGENRIKNLLELIEENKVVDIMNEKNRRALQDLLQLRIDSQEDCPVCMDTMRSPVITVCAHAFCTDCIEKVIETQHKCPMCRAELLDNKVLVQPSAGFGEGEEDDEGAEIDPEETSSKIEAMIQILKASNAEDNTKTVVFSQWTSFLDLVQTQLLKHGLNFTRLDGKMPASRRDLAIKSLNTDPSCKILLASLAVCSVGLNLVAANNVILADSWWAPAIEDQAVDRVHRLGQTRDCKVLRLVVANTIEEEVLAIQAEKRKLAATAFGEKEGGRKRGAQQGQTLQQIQRLLREH